MKTKTKPEAMIRMDFLYRAAHVINGVSKNAKQCKNKKNSSIEKNAKRILSTHLTQLMVGIGRKAVQRASVEVKRTVCKGCRNILIAGENSKCSYGKMMNKTKQFKIVCYQCKTEKKFPLQKRVPKKRT